MSNLRSAKAFVAKPSIGNTFVRRFMANTGGAVSAVFLAIVLLIALVGPIMAPADPDSIDLNNAFAGLSSQHWLGTDDLGRDIFSRLLIGTRIAIFGPAVSVIIAVLIGIPMGLLAGYFKGWLDFGIMRIIDTIMSFPALFLAIAIIGFYGPGLTGAMAAIAIVNIPRIARVVRAMALGVGEESYVAAARSMGRPAWAIMLRHILPNILSPVVVQISLTMALAMLAEAALSFLGLGVQPPDETWGSMLGRAFPYLATSPMYAIVPALCILTTVLALNVLGDALRDSLGAVDPKKTLVSKE